MATIAYGEPRLTNDIDVVIDLPLHKIREFCDCFSDPDFYVSRDTVKEAVQSKHQFNILHPESGLKIDFIVMTESAFDQSRRGRRTMLPILPDREVAFAAPEDVILKKLVYFQEGGSQKHLRDIAGVLRIQQGKLDHEYLRLWAERLGVSEVWRQIVEQARK
jgi:hypothetical protein